MNKRSTNTVFRKEKTVILDLRVRCLFDFRSIYLLTLCFLTRSSLKKLNVQASLFENENHANVRYSRKSFCISDSESSIGYERPMCVYVVYYF